MTAAFSIGEVPDELRARIHQLIVKTSIGCWVWLGGRNLKGYGHIEYHGRRYLVHRLFYALNKGEPGDLIVRHSCDNPSCVNPDHLSLGTHADNIADMVSKGRHRWAGNKEYCVKCGHKRVDDYVEASGQRRCRPCQDKRDRVRLEKRKRDARLSAGASA